VTPSAGRTAFSPPSWQVWSALAVIYVVWGSTYLAIRVMVEDLPPLLSAGGRFLVAGGLLLAVLAARGRSVLPGRRALGGALVIGLLLPAGGNGLVTVAEQDVPSGLAALLIASVPLWVVVLRATAGGERVARGTFGGVALGLAGLSILLLPGSRPAEATLAGVLLCLVAAASWATGSFLSPRLPSASDPLVSTGWQMVLGGVALLVAGVAGGEPGDLALGDVGADAWIAWAYLVTIGSIVAFSAYVWLLRHAPISKVATYAYVNPLVAVLLGWAILAEELSAPTLAGAALVVASVAAIVSRESGPKKELRHATQPARVRFAMQPAPSPSSPSRSEHP